MSWLFKTVICIIFTRHYGICNAGQWAGYTIGVRILGKMGRSHCFKYLLNIWTIYRFANIFLFYAYLLSRGCFDNLKSCSRIARHSNNKCMQTGFQVLQCDYNLQVNAVAPY